MSKRLNCFFSVFWLVFPRIEQDEFPSHSGLYCNIYSCSFTRSGIDIEIRLHNCTTTMKLQHYNTVCIELYLVSPSHAALPSWFSKKACVSAAAASYSICCLSPKTNHQPGGVVHLAVVPWGPAGRRLSGFITCMYAS